MSAPGCTGQGCRQADAVKRGMVATNPGWAPGLEEAPARVWGAKDREMSTQLSLLGQEGREEKRRHSSERKTRTKSGLDERGFQEVAGSDEKLITGMEISVVAGTWGDHMVEETMVLEEVGLWREKPILSFFPLARGFTV